ncbi:MAG TPA: ABC transporter permease, partial [Arsenicitalea sp.]|nr:ABC transporter permease [Arsenicitalea sp.]
MTSKSNGTRAFSPFELIVAGRYLRSRRKDTFISVIAALTLTGVAIGVATLIVVMSVMNGFREELLTKILGLNGHFTAYPIEQQFTDYKDVVKKIEAVPGVVHAVPYVEGQALASGQADSAGVAVRGIDFNSLKKLNLLYAGAKQGGWDGWDTSKGVAIGIRLAQKLGLNIGDPITIVSPNGSNTPFGQTPQIRSYPVNVIFDLGMVEFDSFYVYMPMQAAQDYFKLYKDILKPGVQPPGPDATDAQIDDAYQRQYQATAVEIFIDNADNI